MKGWRCCAASAQGLGSDPLVHATEYSQCCRELPVVVLIHQEQVAFAVQHMDPEPPYLAICQGNNARGVEGQPHLGIALSKHLSPGSAVELVWTFRRLETTTTITAVVAPVPFIHLSPRVVVSIAISTAIPTSVLEQRNLGVGVLAGAALNLLHLKRQLGANEVRFSRQCVRV